MAQLVKSVQRVRTEDRDKKEMLVKRDKMASRVIQVHLANQAKQEQLVLLEYKVQLDM
jgi:hypothetical protein